MTDPDVKRLLRLWRTGKHTKFCNELDAYYPSIIVASLTAQIVIELTPEEARQCIKRLRAAEREGSLRLDKPS